MLPRCAISDACWTRLGHLLYAYEAAFAANDEAMIIDLSRAYHREINLAGDSRVTPPGSR